MEVINNYRERVSKAAGGFNLSIEKVFQRGFKIFRQDAGNFIIYTLITSLGSPLFVILGGPFIAGYYNGADRIMKGRSSGLGDFFRSFEKFLPLFVVNLLVIFIVTLGLIMLIIPGIYFAISYIFAHFFVWFYDVEPAEAIRLSRKTVSGNFGQVFILCLLLCAINFLGTLAFGIGLLITIPLSYCIIYSAFEDIIGLP